MPLRIGLNNNDPAVSFPTDSGTATPTASGAITFIGGTGLNTSGIGHTVTINLDDPNTTADGGTGRESLTDGAILVGDGTNPVELIGPLTDGQLLIGDTLNISPVPNTLTAGAGIAITNGAGSITIASAAAVATQYTTDGGIAVPAANNLNVLGGTGITTSGAGSTVTVTLDTDVSVANGGTARSSHIAYAVICGGTTTTAAQQSVANVGSSGQHLISNGAGVLPSWGSPGHPGETVGSFTPTVLASGSNPTVTYTTQLGHYVQIGSLVYISLEIVVNTISGGSGDLRIGGLPVTSNSTAIQFLMWYSIGVNLPGAGLFKARLNQSVTQFTIVQMDSGGPTNVLLSEVGNGDSIFISGIYMD